MTEPLRLRIALGDHDWVAPLRDGRVSSSRIAFDFADIAPLPRAFREMVRGDTLDVSEMAVITHLLAISFGRPLAGLAIPLWSRLPHANLVCRADSDIQGPADLAGSRIGVRAYAQTSGVWVRGILAEDYGVDLDDILWGTMEDAHLPEYRDPGNTRRYPPAPPLRDLLLAGEFAAIMGERVVDPANIRTVIPDAEKTARAWIERSGIVPINHSLAIRSELVGAHPWLPEALMEMFHRSAEVAVRDGGAIPPAYGLEACHASLDCALRYAHEQRVTPRRYAVEELYLPL